jgi:hypothetical protein
MLISLQIVDLMLIRKSENQEPLSSIWHFGSRWFHQGSLKFNLKHYFDNPNLRDNLQYLKRSQSATVIPMGFLSLVGFIPCKENQNYA